jgi:hypothetical protein
VYADVAAGPTLLVPPDVDLLPIGTMATALHKGHRPNGSWVTRPPLVSAPTRAAS